MSLWLLSCLVVLVVAVLGWFCGSAALGLLFGGAGVWHVWEKGSIALCVAPNASMRERCSVASKWAWYCSDWCIASPLDRLIASAICACSRCCVVVRFCSFHSSMLSSFSDIVLLNGSFIVTLSVLVSLGYRCSGISWCPSFKSRSLSSLSIDLRWASIFVCACSSLRSMLAVFPVLASCSGFVRGWVVLLNMLFSCSLSPKSLAILWGSFGGVVVLIVDGCRPRRGISWLPLSIYGGAGSVWFMVWGV